MDLNCPLYSCSSLSCDFIHSRLWILFAVAQGTNVPSKEIGNILCVDVDAINIDHNGENGVSYASLDEGDDCDVKKMPRLDADTEINSTNSEQLPQVTPTEVERRSFFFGVESSSSPAVALPSENKLNFALLESPSNVLEVLNFMFYGICFTIYRY